MSAETHRQFGSLISRLARRQDLSRDQAAAAFTTVLNNATTPMQQGAFLAALTTKGETEAEIAGAWDAIYALDTVKVPLQSELSPVENSGTGMDRFKTFNISTASAIAAAARGVPMARHGARSITSTCGTVDMAEALGVDVDCPAEMVAESVASAGIGLFNGMSPAIHPGALGRILSQIHFGSTLNIAASLANPALPAIGVRGVYCRKMILPVLRVMKAIGYQKAMVVHGVVKGLAEGAGMDEASVCGPTYCARLSESGSIETFTLTPESFGLGRGDPAELSPSADIRTEALRFAALISGGETGIRKEAVLLNTALIFYTAGRALSIEDGIETAAKALESGDALKTLTAWVKAQNRNPAAGVKQLERWIG